MSWFDGRVLSEEEVMQKSVTQLPSRFQIGDQVLVWLERENGATTSVAGFVVGVCFSGNHHVCYSIAFPIGNGLYGVADHLDGVITNMDGEEPAWDCIVLPKGPAAEISKIIAFPNCYKEPSGVSNGK